MDIVVMHPSKTDTSCSRFTNRHALVTAGHGAIGWAIALRLATEGAKVTVWDINPSPPAAAPETISPHIESRIFDLLDPSSLDDELDRLLGRTLPVDILVNNAGGSLHTPQRFTDLTDEHWTQVYQLNVFTAVRISRRLLPEMVKNGYGRIINLGSKAGRYGSLFTGANYSSAKGAIHAMTLQIAQEYGPYGITSNAVCPGAILTERVERLLSQRHSQEERKLVLQSIPVRRHGTVDDVAAAVSFLASAEAAFITGVMLDVNGGQVMKS